MILLPQFPLANESGEVGRSWTVEDSIAVTYFVTDQSDWGPTLLGVEGDPIVRSPDAKWFFYVTRHGDIKTDSNIYQLEVYAAADVAKVLADDGSKKATPRCQATFRSKRSDHNGAGIRDARWETSESILFLGVVDEGPLQVYRLNVGSGELQRVTYSETDILDLQPSYFANGSLLVQAQSEVEPFKPLDLYPAVAVVGDELSQVLSAERHSLNRKLYAAFHGGVAKEITTVSYLYGSWANPAGTLAVAVFEYPGSENPSSWTSYERTLSRPYQFVLVDLQSGGIRPLLNAPVGMATKMGRAFPNLDALWSADGRHVVLINTTLPLNASIAERVRNAYIVDYDLQSRSWTEVASLVDAGGNAVSTVEWVDKGRSFSISRSSSTGQRLSPTIYTFTRGKLAVSRGERSSSPGMRNQPEIEATLTFAVRQDANEPPRAVASSNGKAIALTDKDPALEGVWWARMKEVSWVEKDGREVKGGLLMPRSGAPNQRVPLIIQAYRYEPDFFRPDGPQFNAYAAQALVSQGMAVLYMDIPSAEARREPKSRDILESPREGELFVERIDAAVEKLERLRLIAPDKVGLIGFSRGGYMTYYAITHPGKTKIAAAVVADAYTASFGEYLQEAALDSDVDNLGERLLVRERQYGVGTFWENKQGWLESPTFNVDRVVTPTLFTAAGKMNKVGAIEAVGAFRICQRPMEYLYFPNGGHQLQRPRERIAAMQASVDWMNFWIQERTSADEKQAARMARWNSMKQSWRELRKNHASASEDRFCPAVSTTTLR